MIKTIRTWNYETVRSTCVKNDYYTKGNNKDYVKMLDFADRHNPTPINIYKVAKDIFDHSDLGDGEDILNIMFVIERDAVTTYYEIEE